MSHKATTYPGYTKNFYKWRYSQQVYDGSAFEYATGENDGSNASETLNTARYYIPKKEQRESEEQYKERLKLIDPATYFATGVDSLVGTLATAEGENVRTFTNDEGQGLGDPSDPDSLAYQFITDADGNGLNWEFIPKQAAIKLAIKHKIFVLVEGIPRNSDGDALGGATVHLIDPEAVINKRYENGRMIECRVKEMRDMRTSMDDTDGPQSCYVDYTLDGWSRWMLDDDGVKVPVGDVASDDYSYWRTREKREKILPIFEVELPLDRMVGYIWARKCMAIANLESALDHAYRNTSFAIFSPSMSKDQFEKFIEEFKKGYNAARLDPDAKNPHSFIAPPSDHFDSMEQHIENKIKNFFYNMFKDYGDVAKERTAAEIRLESQTGIEAFLVLLAGQVDELENQTFWRLEQANFPDSPENWGIAKAFRGKDFTPVDVDSLVTSLVDRFIGGRTVPLTDEQWIELLTKVYTLSGITVPEQDDMIQLIEQLRSGTTQESQLFAGLNLQ